MAVMPTLIEKPTRIEMFPSNIIAHLSGCSREDYFEIEQTGIHSVDDG
jgi:hypothetical protein